jgi:GH15 family glucan-1,4-alpha-glucosidase
VPAAPRIQDYAVIGDCRSAALVSNRGSIDWLCWPRFDSPPIFGALLDPECGRWELAPEEPYRATRRYIGDTNVLETRFETPGGVLVLDDFMPALSEDEKHHCFVPDHEIVRVARCESGEIALRMVFAPRPDFARRALRTRHAGALGIRIETRRALLSLQTDMPLGDGDGDGSPARAHLRAGEAFHFSFTFADVWPAVLPPVGSWTRDTMDRTLAWWRSWVSRLRYDGPVREAVVRSALALRLLVFAPSGAVVAAPTTSLPERVGGDLNWDYRYCWLRDASLTVRALYALGYPDESEAFVSWMMHSTRLTRPRLRILYDVHGNSPGDERALGQLSGYEGSRPVRIGNAAGRQLQLDVYGEVIDALSFLIHQGHGLDHETRRMLRRFGEHVCRHWQEPDDGLWEPRSGRKYNTHSRVLCWTALDRLVSLCDEGRLGRAPPVSDFARCREAIRRDLADNAWNDALASYVSTAFGDDVDTSLLLLPKYGFEAADSPRMKGTYRRVRERLGAGGALLYRYRTGESPGEGAFGICSFWGAEYLAMGGGTREEARDALEELCGYANDVGLFAEQIDPASGDALGNFPQAFTHVGLISAALALSRRAEHAPR